MASLLQKLSRLGAIQIIRDTLRGFATMSPTDTGGGERVDQNVTCHSFVHF
jgi:hypothetical protein